MTIVYFYQYFSTNKGAWGTRVYDFASEWVNQGHQITVVTAKYAKSDLNGSKFVSYQMVNGIQVIVLNILINNKHPFYKRVSAFVLYALCACYYALKLKADLFIASSGPISVGFPVLLAHLIRRKPFVFEVRDLWPEGAVQLGVIKNTLLKKWTYWIEKLCYKNAKLVVTLSSGMLQNIKERFPNIPLISIPNGADIDFFVSKNDKSEAPLLYKNRKIALYTGNIGSVNNMDLLQRAAILLQKMGRTDVLMLLIGDGQQRDCLVENARNLHTIEVINLMPKEELLSYLQFATLALVPLGKAEILNTSSPNKLFEALACGLPVIQTTTGWIKAILAQNYCGLSVDSEDETQLVEAILKYVDDAEFQLTHSENARTLALANFNSVNLAREMIKHIENIA